MRSGSSLRLSRLLKSNSSVVGCFIGTKPLQVVNCGCFATLVLAGSCSCLLVFAALSHSARENQRSPVRHHFGARASLPANCISTQQAGKDACAPYKQAGKDACAPYK